MKNKEKTFDWQKIRSQFLLGTNEPASNSNFNNTKKLIKQLCY